MANRKAKLNAVNAGLSSARRLRRARNAIARRASVQPECDCVSIEVSRPLVVAHQGTLGIAVISGEPFGPGIPPLYGPCMVDADGSFSYLDLEMFMPFASNLREVLEVCFAPNFEVDGLLSVCDLLPSDLASVSASELASLDLGLAVRGGLSDDQRAALSRARFSLEVGSACLGVGQRVQ